MLTKASNTKAPMMVTFLLAAIGKSILMGTMALAMVLAKMAPRIQGFTWDIRLLLKWAVCYRHPMAN